MKVTRIVLVLALVLVGLLASVATVGAADPNYVSGIMVRNLSDTQSANITITFYWAEGTANAGQVAATVTDVIEAKQAKSYYVPDITDLPDGFVGSAVVSADQPVAANLNTQRPVGTGATADDPNRVGTASGVSDPSQTLYFTQVMKAYSGWNSYVAVQNASDTTASVTINYYSDSDGSMVAGASETVSIQKMSTYIFRQSDNAGLSTQWGGSAVVTGDQNLAGVANFYDAGGSPAKAALNSYNAFSDGATKLYVPRFVCRYYGYQGGMKIQNIGTAATDVTIVYTFGADTYTQTIAGLAANAAAGVYAPNVAELATVNNKSGSAVITSSGEKIVATVNENVVEVGNRAEGQSVTYNAFPSGAETTSVIFPQVTSRIAGYSGGVQVQNVGTAQANVQVTFSMKNRTDVTVSATIDAGKSQSWFAPDELFAAGGDAAAKGFNGSATITSDQPLVGIANVSIRDDVVVADGWAKNYGDSFATYNGINK